MIPGRYTNGARAFWPKTTRTRKNKTHEQIQNFLSRLEQPERRTSSRLETIEINTEPRNLGFVTRTRQSFHVENIVFTGFVSICIYVEQQNLFIESFNYFLWNFATLPTTRHINKLTIRSRVCQFRCYKRSVKLQLHDYFHLLSCHFSHLTLSLHLNLQSQPVLINDPKASQSETTTRHVKMPPTLRREQANVEHCNSEVEQVEKKKDSKEGWTFGRAKLPPPPADLSLKWSAVVIHFESAASITKEQMCVCVCPVGRILLKGCRERQMTATEGSFTAHMRLSYTPIF